MSSKEVQRVCSPLIFRGSRHWLSRLDGLPPGYGIGEYSLLVAIPARCCARESVSADQVGFPPRSSDGLP